MPLDDHDRHGIEPAAPAAVGSARAGAPDARGNRHGACARAAPLAGALQVQLAQRVAQKGLSVRETERLVQYALQPTEKEVHHAKRPDRDVLRLQDELADLLGAQVAIRANKRGAGKVLIEFGDLDQLEGILQRLRH
jgi:ParB-like chromosome segregation protein Spo0J